MKLYKKFSDRNTYKARRVGEKDAHNRFYLNCGLKDSKYHVSQKLNINRVYHIVTRRTVRYTHFTEYGIVHIKPSGLRPENYFEEFVDDTFEPDYLAYRVDRFEAIST